MRTLLITFLITGSFLLHLHADEIIPGVLSCNSKNFSHFIEFAQIGDTNDNSFYGISPPRTYVFQSENNDGRQISIRMRSVGVAFEGGNRFSYRQLDENALKAAFTNAFTPPSYTTNAPRVWDVNIISPVADTHLGGQNAISISLNRVLRKNGMSSGLEEIYWVRVHTNGVVEVILRTRSDSEAQLNSLRKCLPGLKIKSGLK